MKSHQDDARLCIPLGRILATPGALNLLDRHALNATELLWRHQHGDWGEVSPHDALLNTHAVRAGLRILSSYTVTLGEKLWIITEADRSVTTLLLPSEY